MKKKKLLRFIWGDNRAFRTASAAKSSQCVLARAIEKERSYQNTLRGGPILPSIFATSKTEADKEEHGYERQEYSNDSWKATSRHSARKSKERKWNSLKHVSLLKCLKFSCAGNIQTCTHGAKEKYQSRMFHFSIRPKSITNACRGAAKGWNKRLKQDDIIRCKSQRYLKIILDISAALETITWITRGEIRFQPRYQSFWMKEVHREQKAECCLAFPFSSLPLIDDVRGRLRMPKRR